MSDTLLKLDMEKAHNAIREIALGSVANTFSECLVRHAKQNDRVCYVGVDTMDTQFKKLFPDRAFDVGIAEQDELGMATGLAKIGLIPVVQGWSPFTPLRNLDQLRTYVARHKANVKIITTTLGLVNCSHGTTHHDLESIAIYRLIPNLIVLAAVDDEQFRQAFDAAMAHEGPVVVMGPPEIYAPGDDGLDDLKLRHEDFQVGRAQWLRRGKDAAIFAVGPALRYVLQATDELEKQGLKVSVINACSIKPFDNAAVEEAARTSQVILTVEEQTIVGGLGSAVAEVLAERGISIPFQRMGIPDRFVEDLGDWTYTRRTVGLTKDEVVRRVGELLGRRRQG